MLASVKGFSGMKMVKLYEFITNLMGSLVVHGMVVSSLKTYGSAFLPETNTTSPFVFVSRIV